MGRLWESEKWDGYVRRSGYQTWKNYRGQQYRAVECHMAA